MPGFREVIKNMTNHQKQFTLFGQRLDISQPYIRLVLIIFVVAVFAKGSVLFPGYSSDDYLFTFGIKSIDLGSFFSQGRYITAAIVWFIDSIGININDTYFSLGLAILFLQAVFVATILRFVGVENLPAAGLVGAIIIAHPYLTEILTFRMALPFYGVALVFSIIGLEMVRRSPATWRTRTLAIFATLAMLFTYQVFLNYFAVAIIFTYIRGQVLHKQNGETMSANNSYRERALTLAVVCTISAIIFVAITRLTTAVGLTGMDGRATVITFDKISERIEQITSALVKIYWASESVFPGWLKTLVALMLGISIAIIFWHLLTEKRKENTSGNVFVFFLVFLLLIPVSLGVIIAFNDWWPVPRVIAHVAIIIGLTFLVADSCNQDSSNGFIRSVIFIARAVVLVGFVFLSNQILADQQRINQWDKMMANRIISRLEVDPGFGNVQFVHINGGTWGFPARLRTIQGDMNISAFFPYYSNVSLLSAVSGYKFEKATGPKAAVGKAYCEGRAPWPHSESVTVNNDVAIICLKK